MPTGDNRHRPLTSETIVFWGRMLYLGLSLLACAVLGSAIVFAGLPYGGDMLSWVLILVFFGVVIMMWRSMIQWTRKRLAASLPKKSKNRLILFMAAFHALLIGTVLNMWMDYRSSIEEARLVREHGAARCPACREFALKRYVSDTGRPYLVVRLSGPVIDYFQCERCSAFFRSSNGHLSLWPREYAPGFAEEESR